MSDLVSNSKTGCFFFVEIFWGNMRLTRTKHMPFGPCCEKPDFEAVQNL